MAQKKRTLWAIDLNGSPLNQFSGNELEIFEDTDHKINIAIDGEILTGAILENLKEGGSSKVSDVVVNGSSVVEDKVASIQLKTINDESITGTENLKLFDTDYNDATYIFGRLFTGIRISFQANSNVYYFDRYQLVNEKTTWLGLEGTFDRVRDFGIQIPPVEDNASLTVALNIVYTANPEMFKQLIFALLDDEPYVFNRTWSNGAATYTVFNSLDAGQMYIDGQGAHSISSMLSEIEEITEIQGAVNF